MIKSIKPLGNKLVVKVAEEEKLSTILEVPDSAKVVPRRGTVVAISDTFPTKEIKVGDKVLYTKYSGAEIQVDNKDCLILMYDDLLGVVEAD